MRDVQGFGKKRSAVGMPRPKKAKVEVPKVFGSGTIDVSTGTTGVEEASASTVAEQDDGTRDDSLEAQDKELRKQVATLIKMARKNVQEAAVDVRKAEAALRHEQRLDEERTKRWWAAERRKGPPPAYLQLERAYKSQVRDLQARLKLSEAQRWAAEAGAELAGCQLIERDVKLARLRA